MESGPNGFREESCVGGLMVILARARAKCKCSVHDCDPLSLLHTCLQASLIIIVLLQGLFFPLAVASSLSNLGMILEEGILQTWALCMRYYSRT